MFQSKSTQMAGLLLSALSLPAIAGCGHSDSPKAEGAVASRLTDAERQETRNARLSQIRDLGNGVFVFPRDEHFAETLSDFLGENKGKYELVSVSQGADTTVGLTESTDSRANSMIVVLKEM